MKTFQTIFLLLLVTATYAHSQSLEPKWEEKVIKDSASEIIISYSLFTTDRHFFVDVVSDKIATKHVISRKLREILITVHDPKTNNVHEVRIKHGKWESTWREYMGSEAKVCKNIWTKFLGEFNAIVHDLPEKVANLIVKTNPNTSGKPEDCAVFKTS